jgi:NADP-dependent 3-hydroxy acid dehydrogenase YdfG
MDLGLRDVAGLRAVAEELGDRAAGFAAVDLVDPAAPDAISLAVDGLLGGLDGLLVNAGDPRAATCSD